MSSDREDYQQDIGAALVEAIERSWSASKTTLKLRVWDVMRDAGYDVPRLEEGISNDISAERRRKGRQQPGPYNRPPKQLEKKFESIAKYIVAKPTKKGGAATVRYELQGPIEKHGKDDLTQAELEAWGRLLANGVRAHHGQRLIADLNATGGGSGTHSGGVSDRYRAAYTSYQLALSRLPREMWPIIEELVRGGGASLTIGRWLLPKIKDEKYLRGAGRAFIKVVAMFLVDQEIKDRGLRKTLNENNALLTIDREQKARSK